MSNGRAATQHSANEWARRLTLLARRLSTPPTRVTAKVGRGLHIFLHRGERDDDYLHAEIVPRERSTDGFAVTDVAALRFGGGDPHGTDRAWLRAVEMALRHLDGDEGWRSWLAAADRRPAGLLTVSADDRSEQMTSGAEVLVRLLEPCQARCAFCNCRGRAPDMAIGPDAVLARLAEARASGASWVAYTGGEPTLVPELADYIRSAKELGFERVTIQTNGLKLAERAYLDTLVEAGLTAIVQSFHSDVAAIHDAIFQIEGAWEKGVQSLANAIDAGLIVGINHVTTVQNAERLPEYVRFIAERFGTRPYVTLSVMAPQGWGAERLDLVPRLTDLRPKLAGALDAARAAGLTIFVPGLCGVPACQLPEHAWAFAELNDATPARIPSRRFARACDRCAVRSRCSGYWSAYLDHHGDAELVPLSATS